MEQILEKLNPAQRRPVEDTEGAVLVIAGAGSGKTRVLTSRIANLVHKGVRPYRILAITFTNKAADEMKSRLAEMVPGAEEMWVSTIHSMCVRILRANIERMGYDRNFSIYSDTDKDRVLKRITETLGYDDDKLLKSAKFRISDAKNAGLSPERYEEEHENERNIRETTRIYARYEEELKRSNSLDFDDLLVKTRDLLAGDREVLDKYADKFQYVHVDEFQDINAVQYEIIRLLCSKHGNIFVVGDDDQSIYGWRGAEIANILNFDKDFRGAKVYKLEQNYRSTKKILDVANAVICKNLTRRQKELWTENDDGEDVGYFDAADETDEAMRTAREIRSLVDRGVCRYGDVAVLMRVNALSRAYEQEFAKYGVPFRVYGGFRFFERKEIKDLIAYLRILNNPLDDESLLRVINVPKRAIGKKTVDTLYEYARSTGLSVFDAVVDADYTDLAKGAKAKIAEFRKLISSLVADKETLDLPALLESVLRRTDFLSQFSDGTEESLGKKMNVDEFQSSVADFVRLNPDASLADYLNAVTLSSDTDDIETDDAVSLATVHAVKGLEFDTVFVCGLDERIFPIARADNSEAESEEERRLMYVAVTRAERKLFLTRAHSRYLFGERQYTSESRFIKELSDKLGIPARDRYSFSRSREDQPSYGGYGSGREGQSSYGYARGASYGGGYARQNYGGYARANRGEDGREGGQRGFAASFLGEKKQAAAKDLSGYRTGAKVRHAKFGEGTVIAVKGSGKSAVADVAFRGYGIKSLAVGLAPMELIGE